MKKTLFIILSLLFGKGVFAQENANKGIYSYWEHQVSFYPQMGLKDEVKAFGGDDFSTFTYAEGLGIGYAGNHIRLSAGFRLGGMVHVSAYKIIYGWSGFAGYQFNFKPNDYCSGITLGVSAGMENYFCHFDVMQSVGVDLETHGITGNPKSLVLSNNQLLLLGPSLQFHFGKSDVIAGFEFGLLPSSYKLSGGDIVNNKEITFNRLYFCVRRDAFLSRR